MGRLGRQRAALRVSSAARSETSRVCASAVSRRVRWAAVGCVLVAGFCFVPSAAFAQEGGEDAEAAEAPKTAAGAKIDEAKQQIEQLDYTGAQQTLLGVVQSGAATSEELAQAYFNLGSVEAALGNDVESTDSFYLALMIQPSLLFPEGGSPKIRERLNAARSRVTEVGVLEARAWVKDGVLDVRLDNDPLELVKRVDVTMTREGGESGKVTLEKGEMRAEVEPGVSTIQVAMFDEAGNQLKVIDVDPAGGAAVPRDTPVGTPPSVWGSWGLWAGVAGALALGGTYFMMEGGNLDGDIEDARNAPAPNPAEVERLEENRDRVGLYGVIGLSMAGAAAITSGALLLLGGDDESDTTEGGSEATLSPNIAPGHYGARFTLKF